MKRTLRVALLLALLSVLPPAHADKIIAGNLRVTGTVKLGSGALSVGTQSAIDVRNYGTAQNATVISDATTTATSTTLTAASAPFAPSMVGQTIGVRDAVSRSLTGNFTPTNGSNIVVTASANQVVLADVGKFIDISGGAFPAHEEIIDFTDTTHFVVADNAANSTVGTATIEEPLVTTIAGFTNTTTVTLTAPATRTVSGVYASWGTDDTAAFASAAAAAVAAKLPLLVPAGSYMVNALDLPSGVTVQMSSGASLVRFPTATTGFVVSILGVIGTHRTNILLSGGTVDMGMNGGGVKGTYVDGLSLEGMSFINGTQIDVTYALNCTAVRERNLTINSDNELGIVTEGVDGGLIENCNITNLKNDGIMVYHLSTHVRVANNNVTHCVKVQEFGRGGIQFYTSALSTAVNNHVSQIGTDSSNAAFADGNGIRLRDCWACGATGNEVDHTRGIGISSITVADSYFTSVYTAGGGSTISGNVVTDTETGGGISVSSPNPQYGDVVASNVVMRTGYVGGSPTNAQNGINIRHPGCAVTGNELRDIGGIGIALQDASITLQLMRADKCVIRGNTITNVSKAASGSNPCISLAQGGGSTVVEGNSCGDDQASPTTKGGLTVAATSSAVMGKNNWNIGATPQTISNIPGKQAGAGSGTTPTITVAANSNDQYGQLTITMGGSPAAGVLAYIFPRGEMKTVPRVTVTPLFTGTAANTLNCSTSSVVGIDSTVAPFTVSTLVSSGTTVTGTGTQFTAWANVGDTLVSAGQTRTITAIASDTSLTTDTAFSPVLSTAAFTLPNKAYWLLVSPSLPGGVTYGWIYQVER